MSASCSFTNHLHPVAPSESSACSRFFRASDSQQMTRTYKSSVLMTQSAADSCTFKISPPVSAATALSMCLVLSGLGPPAQAVNVNRHDFQSASNTLNVRRFPCSLVPTRAVVSPLTCSWCSCCGYCCCLCRSGAVPCPLSSKGSISDRLTCSVHMLFHLRDALHQILDCLFPLLWQPRGASLLPASHNQTQSPRQLSKAIRPRSEAQVLAVVSTKVWYDLFREPCWCVSGQVHSRSQVYTSNQLLD